MKLRSGDTGRRDRRIIHSGYKELLVMSETGSRPQTDLLHGSLWKQILLFSLPVAATGMLEQLFNASDIAIVGSFASHARTEAVAAVGANSPIIGLIVNFFIGIAIGANVIIARQIGQGSRGKIERAVQTTVLSALACGAVVMILGQFGIPYLLEWMKVPADVFSHSLVYMRIYLAGMPAILLYNFEASIFRSIGQTKIPLIALASGGIINLLLNLFFVIVLDMAVEGVAIATVISNVISSLILLLVLVKTRQVIRLELRGVRFDWKVFGEMMKIGFPAGIQSSVFAIANIIVQSAINSLGTIVMAASSAAFNIEALCYYLLNSFTQACTTFTAQNYGAGQIARCRKVLRVALAEGLIATVGSCLLVLAVGKSLLAIFNDDPQVIEFGYYRLLLIFCGYVFSVAYESFSGYLRGFGISLIPALMTVIGVCGVRLSWVAWIFLAHPSFPVLMACYPVSLGVTAILMGIALVCLHPGADVHPRRTAA